MRFSFFALSALLLFPALATRAAPEPESSLLSDPENDESLRMSGANEVVDVVESSTEALSRVNRSPAVLPDVVTVDPSDAGVDSSAD